MVPLLARRALTGACAIVLLLAGLPATQAGAATEPHGELVFGSVSVSPANVDAGTGSGTVHLTWSFTDTVTGASDVSGTLTLRRADGTGTYAVPFDFLYDNGGTASGTVRHPAFAYDFHVPRYARTASAEYQVSKIAATDDQGGAVTVTGGRLTAAKFTAAEEVDTTAPAHDTLQIASWSQTAVYNRDKPGSIEYYIGVSDAQSGIASGKVIVKGPGGAELTAPFTDPDPSGTCAPDQQNAICTPGLTVPANAAAGTWVVDELDLTDAAGNTSRATGLNAAPLAVSANRQLQATDFAFDPPQVDNWHESQVTHLKFTPTGVRQGLSTAQVELSGVCWSDPVTPVIGADGVADIPVTVPTFTSSCSVTGLTLTDNAGDTALYGTDFGAPDPGISVTRTPDTDPPVADSVRLYWTTMPDGTDYQVNNSVIAHTISRVGVDSYSVTVFDSDGVSVGGGDGGVQPDASGNVDLGFSVTRGLPPGTYTVGFTLYDAGGLYTHYGYPNTAPPPGGPLTFTVPASS